MTSGNGPLLTTILAVCHMTGRTKDPGAYLATPAKEGTPEAIRCRLQDMHHTLLCSSCYLFRNGAAIYRCQASLNYTVDSVGDENSQSWFEADLETSNTCITCYLACKPHKLFVMVGPQRSYGTSYSRIVDRKKRQAIDNGKDERMGLLIQVIGPWERPLVALRVISCITVSFLIGISVIIYLSCGMFYQDCLSHMCSEVALVAAYIFILALTTDTANLTPMICSLTAVSLQYFFQVAFLSLMMEAYFIRRVLCPCCPSSHRMSSPITLLLIAWGVPAIITIIPALVMFEEYAQDISICWVNLNSRVMWVIIIPIGIFSSLQLLMLASIFFMCEVPEHVSYYNYPRARTYLNTRWAALFVHLGTIVVWSTGFLAEALKANRLYIVFCIFSILLGAFLPVVRVSTEDQVRMRIWLRLSPDPERRLPWPITSFDLYDDIQEQYTWSSPVEKFASPTPVDRFDSDASLNKF